VDYIGKLKDNRIVVCKATNMLHSYEVCVRTRHSDHEQ